MKSNKSPNGIYESFQSILNWLEKLHIQQYTRRTIDPVLKISRVSWWGINHCEYTLRDSYTPIG